MKVNILITKFEAELDKALEDKINYIIIEPTKLGDETGRWITVGNCLHQTGVATGIASIASSLIWQQKPVIYASLGAVSILCTGLYTISWNTDPCVKYQVEKNQQTLSKVPNISNITSSPVVVLVYKDNKKTKYIHRSVTILATAFCAWRLYDALK